MKFLAGRNSRRALAAIAFAACLIFAANAGRMLVVDAPEQSDVIVVLAGETNWRPALGLDLLQRGYSRRMIIDVPAAAKVYNLTEVELAKQYVQALPQAESVGICPIVGLSTRDESHDVARCLEHENGSRILLVTSDFHTRRSLSTFRHELRGKNFSVAAAYDDTEFGTHWWIHRQWAKTCVDEWMKFVWWHCVDRWR